MAKKETIQEKKGRALPPLLVNSGEAASMLGMGRTFFYALMSTGEFGPEPIRLGRNKKLWSVAELEEWIKAGCPIRNVWQARKRQRNA